MKATGVVRRTDDLGRIGFPIELRRTLDINPGESMEIYTDGSKIYLKKYDPACSFCGEAGNIYDFRGKNICLNCAKEIAAKFNA